MMVPIMETAARPMRRNMVSFSEEKNPHREDTKLFESVFNDGLLDEPVSACPVPESINRISRQSKRDNGGGMRYCLLPVGKMAYLVSQVAGG